MDVKVSAIVPTFNESKGVAEVLRILVKSPHIDEIVCVNDGSSDATLAIVRSFPSIRVVNLRKNHGKAYAVARGIEKAKGHIVLFLDADIKGLRDKHIVQLVNPLKNGRSDFVIGYRSSRVEATIGVPLSGERAYFKKDLVPHIKRFEKKGFGLELYLNYHFKDRRKKIIQLKGVYSQAKHKKYSYPRAGKLYLTETYQILGEFVRQKNLVSYFFRSYLLYIYLRI